MKSITIIGRRWFNKTCGNTYHSVNVLVDGKQVYHLPYAYGYGEMYLQNAQEWLMDNGYVSIERHENGSYEPLSIWCRNHDIQYYCEVMDVYLKRDL